MGRLDGRTRKARGSMGGHNRGFNSGRYWEINRKEYHLTGKGAYLVLGVDMSVLSSTIPDELLETA